MIEDDVPELPDFAHLIEDLKQVNACFVAYDFEHGVPAVCIANMAIHVLDKLSRDDASDIWSTVVHQMRWLASWALDTDRDDMQMSDRAVMEAIINAQGHALAEAFMRNCFASVGMTTTAQ